MSTDHADRIAEIEMKLPALARHARRYVSHGASTRADGTLLIAPSPSVAPMAHTFWLFPAAEKGWIRGGAGPGVSIPDAYADVLRTLNGCMAYDLNLYGISPTTARRSIDRTSVNALRLDLARDWARGYGRANDFHFGGRNWSKDENVGYFLGQGGPFAALNDGRVVGNWSSIQALLEEELPVAERMYRQKTS